VEVAYVAMLHQLSKAPESDWQDTAQEPEVVEVLVNALTAKSACGTNNSPDNARREERAAVGTGEVVGLMGLAGMLDIAECPAICAEKVMRGGTFMY
jgi:hypothetical protein